MQQLIQLKGAGEDVNLIKPMKEMLMNMERKDIEGYFGGKVEEGSAAPQVPAELPVEEAVGAEFAPPGVDIDQDEFAPKEQLTL